MAYELINNGPATPVRIHALVRLLARKKTWDRTDVLDLLEPKQLESKQQAAKDVLHATGSLGLIDTDGDRIALNEVGRELISLGAFKHYLVSSTARAQNESHVNYRFNLFTAWYATRDEEVIHTDNSELTITFNTQVQFDSEDRAMNSTKFNAWRTLAAFLGYGWIYGSTLIPDATVRVRPLVDILLPDSKPIPFATFMARLADQCPELDGGTLFSSVWLQSKSLQQGQRLSLMLSNALRRLEGERAIRLERIPDAGDMWQLYETAGYGSSDVTHISRGVMV